jgi:glycosyltransferase involved in cell wall biosynthesis
VAVALLLLTLNEIEGVKEILPKINKELFSEIVVVDGGSTDGTIEEAQKMGFKVIQQTLRGHGGAIISGVNATTANNILIFGPDGNHDPETIPDLIKKLEEGYDQVINSRFGKTSINDDAGTIDAFGNKMFSFLASKLFGGNLTDTLNEYRIITRKAFNELNFDALYTDSTFQMSIKGMKKKQKMFEIIGNEGARIGGTRKMHPFPTGCRLCKRLLIELVKDN